MDEIKVKNIFAAVSDKSILAPLLDSLKARPSGRKPFRLKPWKTERPGLDGFDVKFLGTQGTVDYLKSKGFDAKSVVFGFDFDGRVKSLDKKVFVAILANPSEANHLSELAKLGVEPLNAVIVDLYPLDKSNFPESMDIGGQALIRAAIKNYKNVALAFDGESIRDLVEELKFNKGETTLNFRKTQAKKAADFIAERTELESGLIVNVLDIKDK